MKLKASAIDSTLYKGGKGLSIFISAAKKGRGQKIPTTVWVFQGLLADVVLDLSQHIIFIAFSCILSIFLRSGDLANCRTVLQ